MTEVSSRWWRVGGRRWHARTAGAGPPVVAVHGLGVSSRYLVPTLRALSTTHACYAVDLPGFGASQRPASMLDVPGLGRALAQWINAAIDGPVTLVANSAGCQYSVECAISYPEIVRGLVLVGPTLDPRARTIPRALLRWLGQGLHEPPSLLPLLAADYWEAGLARSVATLRAVLAHPLEARLPLVSQPTVVMRGSADRIVPQTWAEQVTRLLPNGRLTVVAGGTHAVNYTAPDAVARCVRELAGVDR